MSYFTFKNGIRIARPKRHVISTRDVSLCVRDQTNMAERKKTERKGGRYCVAGAPNGQSCKNNSHTPGIRMHQFPTDPILRAKWIQFVRRHRANFNANSTYTSLCSAHFEESCYERPMLVNMELPEGSKMRSFLKKGSIPTRDAVVPPGPEVLSERRKRQVSLNLL